MYRIIRSTLVVALSFLALTLILGSLDSSDIGFAKKAKVTKGPIECNLIPNSDLIQCCQTETDSKGVEIKYCTNCDDTAPPSNCGPRFQSSWRTVPSDLPSVELNPTVSPPRDHPPLATENLQQLPTTTLQQQTELCPAGSAPDAKGNCSNVENNIQPSTSSDNKQLKGESESEKNIRNDNDLHDSDHNNKDNDPGQTNTEEESLTLN